MAEFDMRKAFQDLKPAQTIASVGATNWQGIQLPDEAKRLTVGCPASPIYLSFSYADNAAASTVDTIEVPAGQYFEVALAPTQLHAAVISKAGAALLVAVIVESL